MRSFEISIFLIFYQLIDNHNTSSLLERVIFNHKMREPTLTTLFITLCFLQFCKFTTADSNNPTSLLSEQENYQDEGFCTLEQPDSCSTKEDLEEKKESSCLRVAVVEYQREDYFDDIEKSARINLENFSKIAKQAKEHNARMIVFPEDGLFYGPTESLYSVLHEIPDPKTLNTDNNNPCNHKDKYEGMDILVKLSCIAKENELYLVANFGTRQSCEPTKLLEDRICPQRGFFALNTDVVYNPQGEFIRRYRKYNMFTEPFDRAPSLETVYFDTPYGRFGIFTCFDLLFKKPAMKLVEDYNIDTAIFPTFWYDELPLLTALQTQDGWSSMSKVNLLSSNIHKRELGTTGTGIFTTDGSIYTGANSSHSKLVIGTIGPKSSDEKCDLNPLKLEIESKLPSQDYSYLQYPMSDKDQFYIFDKSEGIEKVCNKGFCCTIDYKIAEDKESKDNLINIDKSIMIVRNDPRPGIFNWYEQMCALGTLKKPLDTGNLNSTTFSTLGLFQFDRLTIEGTFNSKFVFPVAAYNVSYLMPRNHRNFECSLEQNSEIYTCKLEYVRGETLSDTNTIYAYGMYGRLFESDIMPEWW